MYNLYNNITYSKYYTLILFDNIIASINPMINSICLLISLVILLEYNNIILHL
jgi:hypothetical protein